ncbi:MAG: inositol monophosphatase family protein [Pseudomonadota bacterium]|nr:inositol monophosphatase family protein [Pseudomonadota bacterium]
MSLPTPLINVMDAAARKASRRLVRDFGEIEQLQVSRKGPGDFVTEADRRTEQILYDELSKARPSFGFLMEEGGEVQAENGDERWIIDPIDGTTNFLHGIPHFAISIGVERSGELVAGIVYEPIRDELFWAENGEGAYLNRRRLRVSERKTLADALIATGIPFGDRTGRKSFMVMLKAVMETTAGVRRLGSAALDLAYVAAGRYEGFWETGLLPWDIAGGIVIVREAGGLVSEIDGRNSVLFGNSIIATNQSLYNPLRKLLMDAVRLEKLKLTE